jgi:hypothetical protein
MRLRGSSEMRRRARDLDSRAACSNNDFSMALRHGLFSNGLHQSAHAWRSSSAAYSSVRQGCPCDLSPRASFGLLFVGGAQSCSPLHHHQPVRIMYIVHYVECISNLPVQAGISTAQHLRALRPPSSGGTSLFQDRKHGCLPPGPPALAVVGLVDQGHLPRGSSVSLRWARTSGNHSPLVAAALPARLEKTRGSEPNPAPWPRNSPLPLADTTSAPTFYGARTRFRHEYARMHPHCRMAVAQRGLENSSLTPTDSHLVLVIAQEYRATELGWATLAHLLSETHYSRIALEYGDTAMSASARVTGRLNEDRG